MDFVCKTPLGVKIGDRSQEESCWKWPTLVGGHQSQKNWYKNENFDFDGLELPKNFNKPESYAHCWKAFFNGYNLVIQKIALKCNTDLKNFFL